MNKIKVLIVYHYIANYRRPIFEQLLGCEDIEFYFAASYKSNNDIKLVDGSFYETERFIPLNNYWLTNTILYQSEIFNAVEKSKADVIIYLADPNFISTWLTASYFKFKGKKILFWTHGFIRGNSLVDKAKIAFLKIANKVLLYGNKAKLNLIEHGFDCDKLCPIYNSLNYNEHLHYRNQFNSFKRDDLRRTFFVEPDLVQLYFVGRLTVVKKLHLLLDLVLELKNKHNLRVNLLYIGDGQAKDSLEKLVSANDYLIKHVFFYGQTYDEKELSGLIMSSDICVSPGEIGLTAMHSLAYGIPVVTHSNYMTQMPEYEAVIDGYTGKLFQDNNFDSLVVAVENLITNPIENVKSNCIEIIEKYYTPDVQRSLICEAILDVCDVKKAN